MITKQGKRGEERPAGEFQADQVNQAGKDAAFGRSRKLN